MKPSLPSALARSLSCTALALMALFFAGCGMSSPPEEEVETAVRLHAERIPMISSISSDGGRADFTGRLDSYTFTNTFQQDINGETFHVYDTKAQIKGSYGRQERRMMIGLTKRGETWYSERLDEHDPPGHYRFDTGR